MPARWQRGERVKTLQLDAEAPHEPCISRIPLSTAFPAAAFCAAIRRSLQEPWLTRNTGTEQGGNSSKRTLLCMGTPDAVLKT